MQLNFIDTDLDVVQALEQAFGSNELVRVIAGDIGVHAVDTVVSAGNSRGIMRGGVDAALVAHFGSDIEVRVQEAVDRHGGAVRVGDAITVSTGNARCPRLILAPTMEHPSPVPASNCFFAMMAILREADRNGETKQIYCSGLGTGAGHVPPEEAAREMQAAVTKWWSRRGKT